MKKRIYKQVNAISLNAKDQCFIIQHLVRVSSNICLICQQTSEYPMQRTMLAAVHATEEWLIAPRYLIQISAYLAFSYTKRELLAT